MKRSNITIIAFSLFFIICTGVLFANAKNHKQENDISHKIKTEIIPNYSVLVAEKNSNISINNNDSNSIKIEYLKKESIQKDLYRIANDTLYVNGENFVIISNKNIKSIIVRGNSQLNLDNVTTDSLNIKSLNGTISLYNGSGTVNIKTLNINSLKESTIEFYAKKINVENLKVSLDNSRLNLDEGVFNNVSLSLLNNSRSNVSSGLENIANLAIKKDDTDNKIN